MRPDARRSRGLGVCLVVATVGACGDDGGGAASDAAPIDTCAPSAALVARIDPPRMRADLETLIGLGERRSHAGQTAAAAYLAAELAEFPGLAIVEHSYLRANGDRYVNLEATLAGGARADQHVLVGAHYDSTSENPAVAPGADDNASGTAAVLEVARAMAACAPARNVRFLFFSNEEVGTVGSERYVADRRAAMPPTSVAGFLNVDMIAFGADTEDLDVAGREADRAFVETVATAMETWADKDVRRLVDDHCGCGDEGAFWAEGYTAAFANEQYTVNRANPTDNPNYHSSTDTLATLNLTLHAHNTRALLAAVAALANPPD